MSNPSRNGAPRPTTAPVLAFSPQPATRKVAVADAPNGRLVYVETMTPGELRSDYLTADEADRFADGLHRAASVARTGLVMPGELPSA